MINISILKLEIKYLTYLIEKSNSTSKIIIDTLFIKKDFKQF